MQPIDALDHQTVAADTADLGAAGVEEVAQVLHLRLHGRVLDVGGGLAERRRHHHVGGAEHGATLVTAEVDHAAAHRSRRGEITVVLIDAGADRTQTLDVQVDRPVPDHTAAGIADAADAAARPQRPEHHERSAHGAHQVVGRVVDRLVDGLEFEIAIGQALRAHTEQLQDAQQVVDVGELRHVVQQHHAVHQDRGGQDRQRRVLAAGDRDDATELAPALDADSVHDAPPGSPEKSVQRKICVAFADHEDTDRAGEGSAMTAQSK